MNTIQKGKMGEDMAVKYLTDKGYKILKRNHRTGHKEIDIIAELPNEIVFVEVKARECDRVLPAADAVNWKKQLNLFNAVNGYVIKNKIEKNFRFDIITIVENKIEHIENAFSAFGG
jgi:putative endonuclease